MNVGERRANYFHNRAPSEYNFEDNINPLNSSLVFSETVSLLGKVGYKPAEEILRMFIDSPAFFEEAARQTRDIQNGNEANARAFFGDYVFANLAYFMLVGTNGTLGPGEIIASPRFMKKLHKDPMISANDQLEFPFSPHYNGLVLVKEGEKTSLTGTCIYNPRPIIPGEIMDQIIASKDGLALRTIKNLEPEAQEAFLLALNNSYGLPQEINQFTRFHRVLVCIPLDCEIPGDLSGAIRTRPVPIRLNEINQFTEAVFNDLRSHQEKI